MEPDEQLEMLTADDRPAHWLCPTCRGNRLMLRILYPDEITAGGPLTEICPCRTCDHTGWLAWDPDDHSEFPH